MATTQDIVLDIKAKSDKLEQELRRTKGKLNKFQNHNKSVAKNIQGSWLKITTAVAAVTGAIKGAEKIIHATQETGDTFDRTLAGIKGGLENVMESASKLDFTDLIEHFTRGKKAAKDYFDSLDDIGDLQRAIGIRSEEADTEIKKLRILLEEAITAEDFENANRINEKIIDLAVQMQAEEEMVLDKRLTAWREYMAQKEGITVEDVAIIEDFIKNYDKYDGNILNILSDEDLAQVEKYREELQKAKSDQITMASVIAGYGDVGDIGKDPENLRGYSQQLKTAIKLEDVMNNIVDSERDNYAQIVNSSQALQRRAIEMRTEATTRTRELQKQSKLQDENTESIDRQASGNHKLMLETGLLTKAEIERNKVIREQKIIAQSHLVMMKDMLGSFDTDGDGIIDALGINKIEVIQTFQDKLKETITYGRMLADTFSMVGETIGNAIGGQEDAFKSFVGSMLSMGQQIINMFLAEAIAGMLKVEALKGLPGLITGAIGVGILVGMWNNLVPNFAEGGIVPGTSYTGDRVPAMVNSGEMILNAGQQANLFKMLNGGGNVSGRLVAEGTQLIAVIENTNRKKGLIK